MIVFGGMDASGNNLNDLWVLTNANGTGGTSQWINLIANGATGSPTARSGHAAVYDSANNIMIIFGGCSGSCTPALNDVWTLSNANGLGGTPTWTQQSTTLSPTARTNSAAAYDPVHNWMIIFGGQDGSDNPCSTFSDVWILTYANGVKAPGWDRPQNFGLVPPGQNGASVAYDPTTGTMTLFGGMGVVNGTCQATNAVWQISNIRPYLADLQSVVAEDAAGSPSVRSFASGVYDATGGRMLVFGGMDGSGNDLNEVWALFNATGLGDPFWQQLNPTGGPPTARNRAAAIFDPTSQKMSIFGGSSASGVVNDTWVLTSQGISSVSCNTNAGAPNIVRVEGLAEQVGDLILNCTGGTPTPSGQSIPQYNIQLTLNTNVTNRLLPEAAELSEALLTIDEPFPANPSPSLQPGPSQPNQILCTPIGSACSETGTGGNPSPYATQANVFVGKQISSTAIQWTIPFDPPGVDATRVIRLTNVRVNASELGLSSSFIPTQITGLAAMQGAEQVPIANQSQIVGLAEQGAVVSMASTKSSSQCVPHNAALLGFSGTPAFDFSVRASEGFDYSFKPRNFGGVTAALFGPEEFPAPLLEQNVPGYTYRTETAFYSPSLFTPAPTLGLADFGTRILVQLGAITPGTHLFVPTTITMTGNYGQGTPAGQLQLVPADSAGFSSAGYEAAPSTQMIGTTPVAEASYSGSSAYAVYEVAYADPTVGETVTIPVAVAYDNSEMPAAATITADLSFAPLSSVGTDDASAPLPRFSNSSTPFGAFTLNSCPAGSSGLMWENNKTHEVAIWYLGGAEGSAYQSWAWLAASKMSGWSFVGAADFNGDGIRDLIWQNASTGQAAIWYMGGSQGNTYQSWAWVDNGNSPGAGWTLIGAADFNVDGHPDLMWLNNSTGQVAIWYMGGTQGTTYESWNWLANGATPGTGWTLISATDFNGDGIPDVVWQNNTTRQIAVWYMSGSQGNVYGSWSWVANGSTPGTGWRLVGAVDMNADGHPDLMWQNKTTGQVAVWYLGGADGSTYQSWAWIAGGATPGSGWTASARFN